MGQNCRPYLSTHKNDKIINITLTLEKTLRGFHSSEYFLSLKFASFYFKAHIGIYPVS